MKNSGLMLENKEICIVEDFSAALRRLERALSERTSPGLTQAFNNKSIPPLAIRSWNWSGRRQANNCYNYALNLADNSFLQPGDLHKKSLPGKQLDVNYVAGFLGLKAKDMNNLVWTAARAMLDGLLYLGERIEDCPPHSYPVALFATDEKLCADYHWYALRRKETVFSLTDRLVWAHKPGRSEACEIEAGDGTSIFSDALTRGYRCFAGYYAVNPAIVGPRGA